MNRPRISLVLACLALGAACGGRSVDVDHEATEPGSGGGTSIDLSPKKVVDERVDKFWVDDTRLYWQVDMGGLRSCLLSDCGQSTITYGTPWGYSFGIGAKDVYWLPDGKPVLIDTCPKTGCSGAPRTFLDDPNGIPSALSGDGDYLYWSSSFDIYRCPSAGCGATPELVAANHTAVDYSFTFQGDYVYWAAPTDNSAAGDAAGAGGATAISGILRTLKDGAGPVEQIQLPHGADSEESISPNSFALDPKHAYWIDSSNRIQSCPLEGCANESPVEIFSSPGQKYSLRVDDTGLYWVEPAPQIEGACGEGGALHYCAFANCASGESVLPTDKAVGDYALSGPYLYWTEQSPDNCYPINIQRMAKPTPEP
jgi:hypothetical protein